MKLDRMTVDDLTSWRQMLQQFETVGRTLQAAGIVAWFDLTPGCTARIHTDLEMPGLEADPVIAPPAVGDRMRPDISDTVAQPVDGAPIAYWPPPPPPPCADGGVDRGVSGLLTGAGAPPEPPSLPEAAPVPAGRERDGPKPLPEPGLEAAGAEGEYPAPAEPSALASVQPPRWTAEEDTVLVETVTWQMYDAGLSLHAASEVAAGVLKRPVTGTQFRGKNALKDRILARLAERRAGHNVEVMPAGPPAEPAGQADQPDTAAFGQTGSAAGDGAGPGAGDEPEPAAPVVADTGAPLTEIEAHVRRVRRDRVWTLQRDHDLLHFAAAGWPEHEIALELTVPLAEIKPRFSVLTSGRTFKRDAVLAALAALLPEAA